MSKRMTEHIHHGVPYLSFDAFDQTGLTVNAFSTREGGVSSGDCSSMNFRGTVGDAPENIAENFRRMADALSVSVSQMVLTQQTHTTNLLRVGKEEMGYGLTQPLPWTDVDGLVTNEPGVMLVAFFADCVPLYFLDPVNKAIALSHSGWRGTVNRMAQVTIQRMQDEFGSRPEDLLAGIGPCICGNCYEVDEYVAGKIRETFSEDEIGYFLHPGRPEHYQLDLPRMNRLLMEQAGIPAGQISDSGHCTCCESERFFSHRASGGKRGNLCAFLMMK